MEQAVVSIDAIQIINTFFLNILSSLKTTVQANLPHSYIIEVAHFFNTSYDAEEK
ncbi:hypothetical protein [Edwardsiella ictaluri]|uniref:hypothetical protein n=1 Tax=Edwardsiella ictaluri TaxID=67780 RepID=UPI0021DB2A84|nr:hypothetical protein [Edwardsiella ictaluri]UYB61985.1 hypothetical protein N8I66_01505 [Edwardsiella ictaluri]UYB65211.1 hypothetical protein N8I67_01505 [Edwardsiella ictaluri]BEH97556.1 hypothetical protein KH20906_02840 [Edwardsiella ictaluri]BEI01022.1 hypothetical protein KB20921_02830 [Edwardsiella ictaluri]BEI04496.1 hypothetical protein KH201010_02820 [Edwardsiella ictaluri]